MAYESVVVYTDGASGGNPGPAGIGFVVYDEHNPQEPIFSFAHYIGIATGNVAEYEALISALKWLLKNNIQKAVIYTDSELVYKQLTGAYRVKSAHIRNLVSHARQLLNKFKEIDLKTIPREENRAANKLAQRIVKNIKKQKKPS